MVLLRVKVQGTPHRKLKEDKLAGPPTVRAAEMQPRMPYAHQRSLDNGIT